jgi:hypothetical protein
VPDELLQFQFVPVALTNVTPAGSVSTTFTADASLCPALLTPIVVGERVADDDRIRRIGFS